MGTFGGQDNIVVSCGLSFSIDLPPIGFLTPVASGGFFLRWRERDKVEVFVKVRAKSRFRLIGTYSESFIESRDKFWEEGISLIYGRDSDFS